MASSARANASIAKRSRPPCCSAASLIAKLAAMCKLPPPTRTSPVSIALVTEHNASYNPRMISSVATPSPPPTSTVASPEFLPKSRWMRSLRASSPSKISTFIDSKVPRADAVKSSMWSTSCAPDALATSSAPARSKPARTNNPESTNR